MNASSREAALILACSVAACNVALAQTGAASTSTPPPQDCKPEYPDQAAKAGAQGVSVVAFHVDATGTVTSADVVRSAGRTREHRMLDQATVRGLSACKFAPVRDAAGNPVAGVVTVPYRWVLE